MTVSAICIRAAFAPLKIRLGGTLQDIVIYETEDDKQTCFPFVKNTSALFGFNQGCLPLPRWDELNAFFKESGAVIIFGLNALRGRTLNPDGSATGDWDSTNAESLMRYTLNKGYTIHGFELDNITLVLMNLDSNTSASVDVSYNVTTIIKSNTYYDTTREEYHLTPKDGDLQSQIVLLNGEELAVDSWGQIPPLEPQLVDSSDPIYVAPFSIVFSHLPDVSLPVCDDQEYDICDMWDHD